MADGAQTLIDGAKPDDAPRSGELVPYVPRLTIEWLRDEPERLWREVDGTLAFVDISGFTAMSERLARFGKVGAEEVTEVMNGVFSSLLDDAYAYGGGLLKFGGDALLLLYEGEEHAPRAVRAAHKMRRTLRELGHPRTSAGTVRLRMHVGIHSGTLHFFLVGDSHRELLVAGPGATRTVEMEAASEAGDILVSPETAALLEPRSLGQQKGGGILLKAAPTAEVRLEPLPDVSAIPIAAAVPARVRSELTVGPLEGEHRQAAIGFLRFSGIDALIAERGPAATAEALDQLVRTVQAAADEHEVTFLESDIDKNGGRIILVAGVPRTTGDDEGRLLRTLRAAVDAEVPLPLHVGASRGRVFAGQVGATYRRTYTVLGDTAALAARLMARAEASQILVAVDVLERADTRFDAAELEPFRLKGKSEPVRAAALGRLLEARKAQSDRDLPFVDRERERAVLGASVAPVSMGFGTLVELVGEPGIGKSRLAAELRRLCGDMTVLTVSCDQYASSTPYRAFRDLLRSVFAVDLEGDPVATRLALSARLAEVGSELVPWAPLLAAPLDVEVETTVEVDELEPAFRRARLHGLVASFLAGLLDAPTLLLFEDVHWMDEASSELLRHIGTQLPTRPWLACATRRPVSGGFSAAEGTPPLPAFTLRLEPLPADDARTLVRAAAGESGLRDDEVEAIAERAAGNPLFLQELASVREPGDDPDDLPENVGSLVAVRIDGLAPADRTLLRWASVFGMSFPGSVIQAVLEDDPSAAGDSDAWDRLVEFVERDPEVAGGFRFRHALIRDAAYEGLSFRRRRELHGRLAKVLETQFAGRTSEIAELLSLHFHRAGEKDGNWRYSRMAGERAQEKWANVEATEFYRRALEAARSMPELPPRDVAQVWEALGDCLQLSGVFEDAATAFAAARRVGPKAAPEQVGLMRKEGALRVAMGRYTDALRWYGRGLKAVEELADETARTRHRIGFRLAHAQVRFRQGAFGECIRELNEVVQEALGAADTASLAPAYMTLHTVYSYLGRPERASFRGLALPLYEELGDLKGQATALNNLGIEAYYEGDWVKALDLYERGRALFVRIGDVTSAAMSTNNIGEIRSDQGHVEEASKLFDEVQRVCDTAGERTLSALACANRGRAAARAGRFEEAEELLSAALQSFRELHAASFALETEARLAEAEVLRGETPEEAFERTQLVLGRTEEAAEMAALRASTFRLRGAARLQLGEVDAAHEDLLESVRVARDADAVYEVALALDLLASARKDPAAAAESATLFERLGVERVARPTFSPSSRPS
ncbi:MAG: AAA family ATPase [Actinobacteria bacterium]|nr:AAA family ATPase [Actinomycetota bacterium]